MLKIALAKLLTVKAAAATTTIIAATGVGGVALAASTGVLPNPLVDTPATPSATHAPATPGSPTATTPHPAGAGDASASPSPSLLGLCQAYTAGAAANPGKALDNPAFTVLINAAGGADHVTEYCDTLTAAASAGAIPSRPGADPAGAGRPTAAPASKAGGAPTGRPDTPATKQPAGTATAVPGGPPATPAAR
jgi:hypothetical protein